MNHFIYKNNDGVILIDENKRILLKLNSEDRSRNIGCIAPDKRNMTSYFKQEKEKDVYHKLDAWSLNWSVVSWLPDDQSTINIKSETAIYRITKAYAILCGKFLYHKQSGIEKKIYIPKRYWKIEYLQEPSVNNEENKKD